MTDLLGSELLGFKLLGSEFLDSESLTSFGVQNKQIICDTGEVLQILTIARFLPNQRLVCKCLFNQNLVYAKIFIGLRANIHAVREASGAKALLAANIFTPQLLLQTTCQNQPVIVYAAIENAVNAEDFVRSADFLGRCDLAKKLTQTVAQHHNAHLMQTDIHLKNFLVEKDKVYTLDGDGIRQFAQLSPKQAMQNLAVLWSKFDVLDIEKWQQSLTKTYTDTSAWNKLIKPEKLIKLANFQRLKVASYYADKKVFRPCTDVKVTALRGIFYAASRAYENIDLPVTIEQLDQLVTPQKTIKSGNTCTVATAQISDATIVIKRYNIKSVWHGLSRALRPSRAAISWANAHRLQLLGIATAKPVALLETRRFGLRGRAYFLSEYIEAPDVAQYFAQTQNKTERAEAVKNIVTLFYKLYLLHISHGDMKFSNIKMQGSQPVLIDLDSMHQHAFINQAAHARDLQRFMRNWQNDNALYNAFVKTFKVVYPDDSMLIKAGIKTNKEIVSQ